MGGYTATNRSARSYALLTTGAALLTIVLKVLAYALTGSVGLLSDAAESLVNVIAALVGVWALTLAVRPPDEQHAYGHTKAEYFASGLEGALILLAAVGIGFAAVERLWYPRPLEQVGIGLPVSILAAIINTGVAITLERAGRRLRSITLRSNARHLMTDVWSSVAVVVGVLLVQLTGWLALDPLIALLVATHIVWSGVSLLRDTGAGLLDSALPAHEQQTITDVLARFQTPNIEFHALRTRVAGFRRFVSLHVLVPGDWSVRRGHDLCEQIELAIRDVLPESVVFTHLEPREDPVAWADQELDRAK